MTAAAGPSWVRGHISCHGPGGMAVRGEYAAAPCGGSCEHGRFFAALCAHSVCWHAGAQRPSACLMQVCRADISCATWLRPSWHCAWCRWCRQPCFALFCSAFCPAYGPCRCTAVPHGNAHAGSCARAVCLDGKAHVPAYTKNMAGYPQNSCKKAHGCCIIQNNNVVWCAVATMPCAERKGWYTCTHAGKSARFPCLR